MKEYIIASFEVLDDLTDKSEETGKFAEELFKEKPDLVTCKCLTRILVDLHAYAHPASKLWLIIGIVGGVVGGLVIIGLLVYFFWYRPKKAAF